VALIPMRSRGIDCDERRDINPLGHRAGRTVGVRQLLPLVYDEQRRLAARNLAQARPRQTLEAARSTRFTYASSMRSRSNDGTAGTTSSPTQLTPCAASWSCRPIAVPALGTAAGLELVRLGVELADERQADPVAKDEARDLAGPVAAVADEDEAAAGEAKQ
jgi:hypothetical protein